MGRFHLKCPRRVLYLPKTIFLIQSRYPVQHFNFPGSSDMELKQLENALVCRFTSTDFLGKRDSKDLETREPGSPHVMFPFS